MSTATPLAASGRLRAAVQLGPLTTYRLGGPARWFLEATDEADLIAAGEFAAANGLVVFVLGRGSNVVVASSGFDGLVVHLGPAMAGRSIHPGGEVRAGGAAPLPLLARESARAGRGGLEFYVGIPGTVGGAVRMNAGCHGSDTAGCLLAARVVSLTDGAVTERTPADLALGYRHSSLADHEIVVAARFITTAVDPAESERKIREITRWRKETQPGGTLNAGSVFKNPPGDAAGRIIDSLGLKGLRHGAVEVSTRHANFFVADPGATPEDVYLLVADVRRRVEAAIGILLQPELRFIGDFG